MIRHKTSNAQVLRCTSAHFLPGTQSHELQHSEKCGTSNNMGEAPGQILKFSVDYQRWILVVRHRVSSDYRSSH